MAWITNDKEAAKRLRQADARYDRARGTAKHLPLAEKIETLRAAKLRYAQDRRAIAAGLDPKD